MKATLLASFVIQNVLQSELRLYRNRDSNQQSLSKSFIS